MLIVIRVFEEWEFKNAKKYYLIIQGGNSMWMDKYGIFFSESKLLESKYPKDFSAENLLDMGVRNAIDEDLLEKVNNYEAKDITFQEAQDLLSKVSSGTATVDETIRLLNYVLLTQFAQKNNNLFGDLIKFVEDEYPKEGYEEYSDDTQDYGEDELGKEILNWVDMEEEGKPFTGSYKTDWAEIEANCLPPEILYRIDCNEVQLKNRLKLWCFLDLVSSSPYLYVPPTEQELEERKKAGPAKVVNEIPSDEEVPY